MTGRVGMSVDTSVQLKVCPCTIRCYHQNPLYQSSTVVLVAQQVRRSIIRYLHYFSLSLSPGFGVVEPPSTISAYKLQGTPFLGFCCSLYAHSTTHTRTVQPRVPCTIDCESPGNLKGDTLHSLTFFLPFSKMGRAPCPSPPSTRTEGGEGGFLKLNVNVYTMYVHSSRSQDKLAD